MKIIGYTIAILTQCPTTSHNYGIPSRSLTVRPWKVTLPTGKDRLPTAIFQGVNSLSNFGGGNTQLSYVKVLQTLYFQFFIEAKKTLVPADQYSSPTWVYTWTHWWWLFFFVSIFVSTWRCLQKVSPKSEKKNTSEPQKKKSNFPSYWLVNRNHPHIKIGVV